MNSPLKLMQMLTGCLIRKPQEMKSDIITFRNPFTARHYREGKLINVGHGWNDVTVVGKNHMLDVTFGNSSPVTQVSPWYIGLVNNTPTPVFNEADTLASHSGWSELTGYTGNRQAWVDANASAKVKGTTSASVFPITATATINGLLIASVASGTSGVLWATGSFDTTFDVINGDTFNVTYGIRC
jgi:hypothetical protein